MDNHGGRHFGGRGIQESNWQIRNGIYVLIMPIFQVYAVVVCSILLSVYWFFLATFYVNKYLFASKRGILFFFFIRGMEDGSYFKAGMLMKQNHEWKLVCPPPPKKKALLPPMLIMPYIDMAYKFNLFRIHINIVLFININLACEITNSY